MSTTAASLLLSLVLSYPSAPCSADGRCTIPIQYGPAQTPEEEYKQREDQYRKGFEENLKRTDEQRRVEQNQGGIWGAIAYSPGTGESGYSEGYTTRAGAIASATRECGHADCETSVTFQNACGALSVADNDVWSGQWNSSRFRAERLSQSDCERRGGQNCEIVTSQCSPKR
jgi:Domain of unknown function (DUF4189)